jgi:hypothetical protein
VRFGVDKAPITARYLTPSSLLLTTPATEPGDYAVWVSANDGADWFGPSTGVFTFASCPTGQFALTHIEPCRPCPAGTYGDREGLTSCKRCPDGEYAAAEGSIACAKCPANSAVPLDEVGGLEVWELLILLC